MNGLADGHLGRRKRADILFRVLSAASAAVVILALLLILGTILWKSVPALSLSMLTQTPKGGFYLGKEGGILNAIVGSIYLAAGATILALVISIPIVLYLTTYAHRSRLAGTMRLSLDVMWGIPSIVYGAFAFILMLAIGMRASLLAGIIVLALIEIPIMVRAMDEVIRSVPQELRAASYSLGATRLETAAKVVPACAVHPDRTW